MNGFHGDVGHSVVSYDFDGGGVSCGEDAIQAIEEEQTKLLFREV
jgi:hypothetical protein